MTTIIISRKNNRKELIATGHATGSEQVCAGVSAIVYALAGWLANSDAHEDVCVMEPGNAHIMFSGGGAEAEGAFKMAEIGLLQIARANPEYLRVKNV